MNKEKIIDYIYDEMTLSERIGFEKKMLEDASLRAEVEQLMESRTFIAQELDYLPPNEVNITSNLSPLKKVSVSKWWAIAASMLLLCASCYFLGLRIGVQDKSLVIGFEEINAEKTISKEEEYISKKDFFAAMGKLEQSLMTTKQEPQVESINKEDISKIIELSMRNLDKKYKSWSKESYVAFQEDSRYQTEILMQEFLDYYEIKRSEDLKQINDGLTNLALMVQENSEGSPQFAYQPAE